MKTTTLIAVFACLFTLRAQAQRNIIKFAPLSSFGYEHVLNDKRSIYGGISIFSPGIVTAIGLKAEYRFYGLANNGKAAPEGLWVAPTLQFWTVNVNDGFGDTGSAFVSQLGGIAGYQWIFNQKISLEPALGLAFTAVGAGTESILGAGVLPLFALRVGYVIN